MMTGTCVQLGNYRVHLSRQWRPGGDTVVWIMANPSTADAKRDDPTIQRVVKFSKRWGYGRCEVVNLHPRVSPDPKVALADGPSTLTNYNQVTIQIAMERAALVVVAWGAVGAPFWAAVTPLLRRDILRHGPRCLAKTKAGHPTHPMARGRHRIPDDAAAIPWSVFAAEWRTAGPSIGPVDAAQLAAHLATDLKAGWAGPSLDYDELLALVRQGDIDV
ncbi:MAG: DUF1643 domain-containing protein, partial [Mycobacterium sp.]